VPAPQRLIQLSTLHQRVGDEVVAVGAFVDDLPGEVEHLLGRLVIAEAGERFDAQTVTLFAFAIGFVDAFEGFNSASRLVGAVEVQRQVDHGFLIVAAQVENAFECLGGIAMPAQRFERQAHPEMPLALIGIHGKRALQFHERLIPLACLVKLVRALRMRFRVGPIVHCLTAWTGSHNNTSRALESAAPRLHPRLSAAHSNYKWHRRITFLLLCIFVNSPANDVRRSAGSIILPRPSDNRLNRRFKRFKTLLPVAMLFACLPIFPCFAQTRIVDVAATQPWDVARDTARDPVERRAAIESLLRDGSNEPLVDARTWGQDAARARLIVQSLLVRDGAPAEVFAMPLLDLLARADEPTLADMTPLLARYGRGQVTDRLSMIARDEQASVDARRAAVRALAGKRNQVTAQLLIGLIGDDQPPALRRAALEALAHLSGIEQFGVNADAWRDWWTEHRALPPQQWHAMVAQNLGRRVDVLRADNQRLRDRIVATQRQVYRLTSENDQPPLLVAMLDDENPAVRQLAIDLLTQRLIDLKPSGPELRRRLIAALDDARVSIRLGAAKLLRGLNDPAGADEMARRLVEATESDAEVLRVYLLMMADQPRAIAISRAMELLDDPRLRDEAAGVLAGAAQKNLLSDQHRSQLQVRLQSQVPDQQPPMPKVIELLGYVGDELDWQRIRRWIDHESDEVKVAAATAWARSDRPLDVLARRSEDLTIQSIVIPAAAQRGRTPATMFALIEHKPQSQQGVENWERALVAMASRLEPIDVLASDDLLERAEQPLALRNRVLSAAIGVALPAEGEIAVEPAMAVNLLLRRAEVQLSSGEPRAALADLALMIQENWEMSLAQDSRHDALTMAAKLETGDLPGAFEVAAVVLEQARESGTVAFGESARIIAELFVVAAQRDLDANQPDKARTILTQLRETVEPALSPEMRERIADIESRAAAAIRENEPATTPDAHTESPATGGA